MSRYSLVCLFIILIFSTFLFSTEIVIVHTSNIYGTVFPYNYFRDRYEARGLSVIDTYVKEQRKTTENLILVDTGNLFYGSPFGDFSRTIENKPVIEAVNLVGYDIFVPGTLELEFEKDELNKTINSLKAVTLGANLNNISKVQSYIVKQLRNGLKIGIVGVVTPYGKYNFAELISSTKKAIDNAKKQGASIVILATSGGVTKDPLTSKQIAMNSKLNIADKIIKEFSKDVDVFLLGNQSFVYANAKSNKAYSLAGSEGKSVNKITINVDRVGNTWKLKSIKVEYVNLVSYTPSEDFLEKFEKYEKDFQKWLNEPIFVSAMSVGFNKYMALMEDNTALEIVNKSVVEYTKASIGIWNVFNPNYSGIVEGEFLRKDLYSLIGITTTVKLVRMSGKQIKDILISSLKNLQYENGKIKFKEKLANYPWLFDLFENLNYELVINDGKLRNLIYAGKPLEDKDTLIVSIPSVRTCGRDPMLVGEIINDFEIPVQYMVLSSLQKLLGGNVLSIMKDDNRKIVVKLEYIVSPGDTLRKLSYRLAVSEEELVSENNLIKNIDLIRPGWKLIYYKKYLDLIPPLKEFFDVE